MGNREKKRQRGREVKGECVHRLKGRIERQMGMNMYSMLGGEEGWQSCIMYLEPGYIESCTRQVLVH